MSNPTVATAYYSGTPLTEELAARIQEQVPGIKGYNATYTNYTVPVDAGRGRNPHFAGHREQ